MKSSTFEKTEIKKDSVVNTIVKDTLVKGVYISSPTISWNKIASYPILSPVTVTNSDQGEIRITRINSDSLKVECLGKDMVIAQLRQTIEILSNTNQVNKKSEFKEIKRMIPFWIWLMIAALILFTLLRILKVIPFPPWTSS